MLQICEVCVIFVGRIKRKGNYEDREGHGKGQGCGKREQACRKSK